MRFCCSPLRVVCVFVYVRVYMCISETAVVCVNKPMPVHESACLCMCVCCVCICVCVPLICVCSILLETSNPTFLFHCLNEKVKRLLVVIIVINVFSSFPPMKSALTSSTFPSSAGCGLFCKEIPLFMIKWVLHYLLLFNHWPFYELHLPRVHRCA